MRVPSFAKKTLTTAGNVFKRIVTPKLEVARKLKIDEVAFVLLFAAVIFLPIFFIPVVGFSLGASKWILLSTLVLISCILWIIGRLEEGSLSFPYSWSVVGLLSLPIVYAISSFFSPVPSISFIGENFETGTTFFIFLLVLITFLSVYFFRSLKRIFGLYSAFLGVFLFLVLIHAIRLIGGGDELTLGILSSPFATLLGNWTTLASLCGFILILIVVSFEFLPLSRQYIMALAVLGICAFIGLAIGATSTVWAVFGGVILFLIMSRMSFFRWFAPINDDTEIHRRSLVPILPLILFLATLLFLFAGSIFREGIVTVTNIAPVNIELSLPTTITTVGEAWRKNPLLGVGPNRFLETWSSVRPLSVLSSKFATTSFEYGFGILGTSLVTTGVLGFFSWLFVISSFVVSGGRGYFILHRSSVHRFYFVSAFLLALYAWLLLIVSRPSITVLVLAFLMTGVIYALLALEGIIHFRLVSFSQNPKVSVLGVSSLLVALSGFLIVLFIIVTQTISYLSFVRGANDLSHDPDGGARKILRSTQIRDSVQARRALVNFGFRRLAQITANKELSLDTRASQFQSVAGTTLGHAQVLVKLNAYSADTWVFLGRTYSNLSIYGVGGATNEAHRAYDEALRLRPNDPFALLLKAEAYALDGKSSEARNMLLQAWTINRVFLDVYLMGARIEQILGDNVAAQRYLEAGFQIFPGNQTLLEAVDFLRRIPPQLPPQPESPSPAAPEDELEIDESDREIELIEQ